MKLLVVTPAYIPDWNKGGSIRGCHEFAKSCKRSKIDITISTLDTCQTERYEESIDEIKILRFRRSKILNNIAKSGFGISFSWLTWFLKNAQKYDVIYFRSIWNFTSLVGPVYCVLINKKFGFCASGKLSKYAMGISKNKKKAVLFIFKYFFNKANFIHYATNQEKKEQVLKIFSVTKAIIIPPSVNSPKKDILNKKLKYYSVSRFDPLKNIEYILNNFPVDSENFTQYGEIISSSYYFNFLKNIQIKRNLQKNDLIKFGNYVNKEKLDKLYGFGSVFILCSHSEGLSNSALEALARGSVAIVSKGSRMQDYIKSGAVIEIDCSKGSNLKNLISSFDFNKVVKMGKQAKRYMQDTHSDAFLGRKIKDEFESLL